MHSRPLHHRARYLLPLLAATLALGACVSGPPAREQPSAPSSRAAPPARAPAPTAPLGRTVADLAVGMVGAPYRYGGSDPRQGFDCSGLVFWSYTSAGHSVPRTSLEQFRAARKIALDHAAPGDLMFFQDQDKLSHVGIYLGDGSFVHAPASGRGVTVASISTPYYQRHLVGVGRLLPN